jgi:hypothetical protein
MPTHKYELLGIEQDYLEGKVNGWVPNYEAMARIQARNQTPNFGVAGYELLAHLEKDAKETFLWRFLEKACQELFKYKWLPQYQQRGTCVGQAHKLGADDMMAIGYYVNGLEFPGRASVAGCYTGGRVEVSHQPGRWDGSYGAPTVEWMQKGGILLLKDLKLKENDRDNDEGLAVKWTASSEGIPSQYELSSAAQTLAHFSLVQTIPELIAALVNAYVVTNCTDYLPQGKKDANGFAQFQRQRGGHCTLFRGVRFDPLGFLYQNSWSEDWASQGGKYPDDQPAGSVWLTEQQALMILQSRDCWAIIDSKGIQRRAPKIHSYVLLAA